MVKVTCLGAAGCVTGSNYLIEDGRGRKVLVDCGMFQGGKRMELRNTRPWDFDPAQVGTLFLTHAHIDHSGRIPKLVRDGFGGRILTSPPTAELLGIMLLDAAHIQEMDAQWQTRKNRRRSRREVQPLYTTADALESLKHLSPVEPDEIVSVAEGLRVRLRNAGHILGSAILELWVEDGESEIKLVFSGDIGQANQLIIQDPHEVFQADYLFVESTYGNRLHKSYEASRGELLEAIEHAVSHNEKVIIPAFAVERTQEIIYVLGEFHRQKLLPDIPIYLDSPLAIKATEIFRRHRRFYDEAATAILNQGCDPFRLPNLHYTPKTQDSMAINNRPGPAIIIAGNGMCTAGRIKHHLKHNLWREGASIVIVGFQAQGTTGRQIVDGKRRVKIFQEDIAVNARVFTIGGFSSHADQNDLLHWVGNFAPASPRVFVVHGEEQASRELARLVGERFGLETHVPSWRENLSLTPRERPLEVAVTEEEVPDLGGELLRACAALEDELAHLRQRVLQASTGARIEEEDLERLSDIREELQQILAG